MSNNLLTGITELDLEIMGYLPNVSLIGLRQVNKTFRNIIDEILALRYRRAEPQVYILYDSPGAWVAYQDYRFYIYAEPDHSHETEYYIMYLHARYRDLPIWNVELGVAECLMEDPAIAIFPEMGLIYGHDGGGSECICNISDGAPLQTGHKKQIGSILVSLKTPITCGDHILGVHNY